MSITKWHAGKLIILWSWGGVLSGLALTIFLSGRVDSSPVTHLVALLAALLILMLLSVITWKWLSGRESDR
jgi:hypothetical protein